MTESITIEIEIKEGDGIETDDNFYRIEDISEGVIAAHRYSNTNREYTAEEFSRILNFSSSGFKVTKNVK